MEVSDKYILAPSIPMGQVEPWYESNSVMKHRITSKSVVVELRMF